MKRIYNVYNDTMLSINTTIKNMPFNVWRDASRFSYQSTELPSVDGGYSIFRFANKEYLEKAIKVLNGACYEEVNADNWEKWRNSGESEQ